MTTTIIIRAATRAQALRIIQGMFKILNNDPNNPSYLLELGNQVGIDLWEVYSKY